MNTLKPLLIVAVLAGIGYGVYVRINNGNDAAPPEVAEGWDAPRIQLPEAAAPTAPLAWSPPVGSSGGAAAPPSAAGTGMPGGPPNGAAGAANAMPGGEAPRYSRRRAASDAPPYNPPTSAAMPGGTAPSADDQSAAMPAGAAPAEGQPPDGQPSGIAAPDVALPEGASPSAAEAPPVAAQTPPDSAPPATADAAAPADPASMAPPNAAPSTASAPAAGGFAGTMDAARHELESGQLATALRQLSAWYDDPRLTPVEQQQLSQLLDQVAGTVVYSTQHLLEPPYEVQPNERLEDIAQRYNVPWQLLAKINGIEDPQTLRPASG